MNVFALELRHSSFRVGAPALALVGSLVAISNAYPTVATWTNVAEVFISSAQFAAPFWAALGAWEVLRMRRRSLEDAEATAARSHVALRAPQYLAALTWMLGAVAVVLVVVVVRGTAIGLFDAPLLVPLLVPFAVSALAVTVGFALGDLVRLWIAIPIALTVLVAIYAVELFRIEPYWLKALGPLHSLDLPEGTQFVPAATLGQVAITFGITAAVIAATTLRLRADRLLVGIAGVLGVTLLVSGGVLVASRSGIAFAGETHNVYLIETSDPEVTLEVEPQYRAVEHELASRWGRVADLFSASGLRFTHLEQDLAPDYGEAPYQAPFRVDLNPASETIAQTSIDMMIYDISACATREVEVPDGVDYWDGGQIAFMLWLRESVNDPLSTGFVSPETLAAARALDALDLEGGRAWVAAHETEIRTCLWEASDFP